MKKLSLYVLGTMIAGLFAMNAMAVIEGSLHDLSSASTTGAIGESDQTCVYCHTPHGGASNVPLWNREMPTSTYTTYSSDTLDADATGGPGPISQACLSCHDGSVGYGELLNTPGSGTTTPLTPAVVAPTIMTATSGMAFVGTDLSNDHPVGIVYDATLFGNDPGLNDPSLPAVAALLRLDGTELKVECASCHEPHTTDFGTFLRMDNAASALCTTCHAK